VSLKQKNYKKKKGILFVMFISSFFSVHLQLSRLRVAVFDGLWATIFRGYVVASSFDMDGVTSAAACTTTTASANQVAFYRRYLYTHHRYGFP